MIADAGARRLEAYLTDLYELLRGVPGAEPTEIVEELRSHVLDSLGGGPPTDEAVGAVLDRLGSPGALADLYKTESLLARASRSASPWLLLRGVLRLARLSAAGLFAFLSLLAGYTVAISFAIAALVKPFAPDSAGLWRIDDDSFSLHLGLGGGPPQGQELLGLWIVPIGLLLGAGCVWLTMRFGRWCIRRFRPAAPLEAR